MKKTQNVPVHMTTGMHTTIGNLAELEGTTRSEWIHNLITQHLKRKVDESRLLQTYVDELENEENA